MTSYEVGFKTFKDCLNLDLPEYYDEAPPGEDVIEFLQKWGPLGLFFGTMLFVEYVDDKYNVLLKHPAQPPIPHEEHWKNYHTRQYKFRKLRGDEEIFSNLPDVDTVFNRYGYFEQWSDIHMHLQNLQLWYDHIKEDGDPLKFNDSLDLSSLRPRIIQVNEHKYEWSIQFDNLVDALVGLHGQTIIGKVRMETCANPECGNRFNATGTRRSRFCSDSCSVKYYNNKMLSDSLTKEKRKLQARAGRRGREIGEDKVSDIKHEISRSKTKKELKAIEKKYGTILEARKPFGSPENKTGVS